MMEVPDSMEQLVYWTRRKLNGGSIKTWVNRKPCQKCGKELMSKPVGKKGKVKIRAKYYICPACGHQVDKETYEGGLLANIQYICPHCKHEGDAQIPFRWKTYKGAKSLTFPCEQCNEKISITRKMKPLKGTVQKMGDFQ